jgi:hypothetical protein
MGENSQAPMEAAKSVGAKQRQDQEAGAEDDDMPEVTQIEGADTADEKVADGKIEKAPQDIDHRGGQAYTGR